MFHRFLDEFTDHARLGLMVKAAELPISTNGSKHGGFTQKLTGKRILK